MSMKKMRIHSDLLWYAVNYFGVSLTMLSTGNDKFVYGLQEYFTRFPLDSA